MGRELDGPLISLFLPDLMGGGAERVMVDFARGLGRRGIRTDLVVGAARGPYVDLVDSRVDLVDLSAGRALRSIHPLAAYLRRRRPSVLFSTRRHGNVTAVLAARAASPKLRVVVRETNMLTVPGTLSIKNRLIRAAVRVTYPRADAVISNSAGVRADVMRWLGPACPPVHVIPNPIVLDEVDRLASKPASHPWTEPGMAPLLVSVGSLTRQKDGATLLRAFRQVRRSVDARLLVLGEGPERSALEELAVSLGIREYVAFMGFVDNPFAYMARASVFVLSSRWEGSPNVLLQAMACGCPVVSTACPSGPEELLANGTLGALVPVGDPQAMAAAIIDSLSGPSRTAEARMTVAANHDVEVVTSRLLPVLLL